MMQLMAYLKAIYQNYYKDDIDLTVMAWADALIDNNAKYIMLAAKEFVKTDTSGFPPAIGQLREIARKFKHDDLVDEKILQLQEPDDRVSNEELEKHYLKAREILKGGLMYKCECGFLFTGPDTDEGICPKCGSEKIKKIKED